MLSSLGFGTLLSSSDWSTKTSIPAVFAIILLLRSVILYRGNYLRKFNGPFLAAFTDLYKYWLVISHRNRIVTVGLHNQYGDVVRVGPNKLSFADRRALKDIYSVGKGFGKVLLYTYTQSLIYHDDVSERRRSTG
jgi:hypothetical protein